MSRWESLLVVQGHDTRADQLAHRLDTLPERQRIVEVEARITALDGRAAAVDERRGELTRSQQRLEDEIATLSERANQAEKQLYSGSVTNPRELQALQDDVASIRRRIGQIEDQELEIMELSEPVEAERAKLEAERAALDDERQQVQGALDAAKADIEAELVHERRARRGRCRRPRRPVGRVRPAAKPARRRGHRPAGRLDLSGLPSGAVRGRGRPHPQARRRRGRALRGVRSPPRTRLDRDVPCSSGSPAARSCWCGWCSAARPSTTGS